MWCVSVCFKYVWFGKKMSTDDRVYVNPLHKPICNTELTESLIVFFDITITPLLQELSLVLTSYYHYGIDLMRPQTKVSPLG